MRLLDLHFTSTFIIVYLFIAVIISVVFFIKHRENRNYWLLVRNYAIAFYFFLLFKVTVLPFAILTKSELEEFLIDFSIDSLSYTQWQPFYTISRCLVSASGIVQLTGNIILLVPLVIILRWLIKKRCSYRKITIISFLSSIAIEAMQYLINVITVVPWHSTDVDDFILNGVGILLCCAMCLFIEKRFSKPIKNIRAVLGFGEEMNKKCD